MDSIRTVLLDVTAMVSPDNMAHEKPAPGRVLIWDYSVYDEGGEGCALLGLETVRPGGVDDDVDYVATTAKIAKLTRPQVAELRDALTSWLDAPRLAARQDAQLVETCAPYDDQDGAHIGLLRTGAGEWGVANYEEADFSSAVEWHDSESAARRAFYEALGATRFCEGCSMPILDGNLFSVDGEGTAWHVDCDAPGRGLYPDEIEAERVVKLFHDHLSGCSDCRTEPDGETVHLCNEAAHLRLDAIIASDHIDLDGNDVSPGAVAGARDLLPPRNPPATAAPEMVGAP